MPGTRAEGSGKRRLDTGGWRYLVDEGVARCARRSSSRPSGYETIRLYRATSRLKSAAASWSTPDMRVVFLHASGVGRVELRPCCPQPARFPIHLLRSALQQRSQVRLFLVGGDHPFERTLRREPLQESLECRSMPVAAIRQGHMRDLMTQHASELLLIVVKRGVQQDDLPVGDAFQAESSAMSAPISSSLASHRTRTERRAPPKYRALID